MGMWMVYETEYGFEYRNEYHASSRFAFFYVWVCAWFMRSNIDLNIEMNIMPAADSRFFMYVHMVLYEIECSFEYRNELHARSRFKMNSMQIRVFL